MRAVHVHVRSSDVERVLATAGEHEAFSAVAVPLSRTADGAQADEEWSLVLLHLPNDRVGRWVDRLRDDVSGARIIIQPTESLPLDEPGTEIGEQVRHVSRLSTLELVIASLQSTGSWRGMLMFSVLAGITSAYALIFDIAYVAVAAMLINPMGSSVLVSVIGIAIGDARMWGWGIIRFGISLVLQAATALLVGLLYGLSISTPTMEQVTSLSAWVVVLAFVAGAAGAQAQVKSDRDSLVSGTAAGFLVAAALAPPTSVLGLSVALGRWDYVSLMAFLLPLQYVALTTGGWVGLTIFGVRTGDPGVDRGSARARTALLALTILLAAGMVFLQTRLEPRFLKADLTRAALEISRESVNAVADVALVESMARFTRRNVRGYDAQTMLVEMIVERQGGNRPDAVIAADISARVRSRTDARMKDVIPFVHVSVIPGPQRQDTMASRTGGQ